MAKKKLKQKTALDIFTEMEEQAKAAVEKTTESGKKNLTSYGKQYYIFPQLKQLGFDSYEKIRQEYELIIEKKSNQPVSIRTSILNLMYVLNKRLEEANTVVK